MDNPFKNAVETYARLKEQFRQGEITRGDFLEEMKNLQVRDDQNRLWMIGNQSGKWYVLKGKDWEQSDPPVPKKDARSVCPYCGLENKPEAEVCARCGGNVRIDADICPRCRSRLQAPLFRCPICDVPESQAEPRSGAASTPSTPPRPFAPAPSPGSPIPSPIAARRTSMARMFSIRSIGALSFAFFGGALGIVQGIVLGSFVGSTRFLSGLVKFFPGFLSDMQGTLVGAVVYATAGGLAGFIALGLAFLLLAAFINLILSFVGGIKVRMDEP